MAPALVLVHTLDLAEQWRDELHRLLGIDAGVVGDDEVRPAPVTVGLIQALCRWPKAELDAFLAGFGLVVLDEAHHVAASTFRELVGRCPARYRLGLTATPDREDGRPPTKAFDGARPPDSTFPAVEGHVGVPTRRARTDGRGLGARRSPIAAKPGTGHGRASASS